MIRHIMQPNHFTCGVTCVSMLSGIDIDEYTHKYNIDDITGSTSDKMISMLNDSGLSFKAIRTEDLANPYNYIKDSLEDHYIIIMVFTPIPHWIIVTNYDYLKLLEKCSGIDYNVIYDPCEYRLDTLSINYLLAYMEYTTYLDMTFEEFDEIGYYKMFLVTK